MRLNPRFSLRSLLLLVLTLAAFATVWRNFDPWRIEREFLNVESDGLRGFSPDGKWVHADLCEKGKARTVILNSETDQAFTLQHEGTHNLVDTWSKFSKDSQYVLITVYGGDQVQNRLWDIRANAERPLPALNQSRAFDTEFSPDSRYVLLRNAEGEAQWIDLQNDKVVAQVKNMIFALFSRQGDRLALTHADETIRILDVATGREVQRIEPSIEWDVKWAPYYSDNFLIAPVTRREYDPNDSVNQHFICFDLKRNAEPHLFTGEFLTISRDETLVVVGDLDEFRVLDLHSKKVIGRHPSTGMRVLEWVNNDTQLLDQMNVSLYDITTGKSLHQRVGSGWASLSPDHSRIFCVNHFETDAHLYALQSGELLQVFPSEHTGMSGFVAFNSDGHRLVTQNTDSHAIHIWRRHRPEHWYGLAWLPEFWLSVILFISLALSLRRDWRDRRNTRMSEPAHAP